MSELPVLGETNAVHATLIEASEYEAIVGITIVLGIYLILAPAVLTGE